MEKEFQHCAVLLIEFQKTWTEKGVFHSLIKEQYESRKVLENMKKVLAVARARGVLVMHAPLILDKRDRYRYKKAPFPARLLKRFETGTWKAELTDGVHANGDIVIRGRSSGDACIDSDLLEQLNDNGIKRLYVGGFVTNHCVKETILSLIDKGFDCTLISDCTATTNEKRQKETEEFFKNLTGKQLTDLLRN